MKHGLWTRIVVAQLVVALALSLALPFLIGHVIQGISDHLTRQFLSGEADRWFAAHREWQGSGGAIQGSPVTVYSVVSGRPQLISGTALPDLPSARLLRGQDEAFWHGSVSDFYIRSTGPDKRILIGEDRRRPAVLVDDVIASFLQRFAIIVPLALLASTAASLLAVNRALRPVRRAAKEARSINPVQPGTVRLHQAGVPEEVLPLVYAANELLDRAAADFERERVFAATVVHELRTALATISLRAEALDAASDARRSVLEAVERANRVVSQMLELHGRGTEVRDGSVTGLSAAVGEVVEQLQEMARSSGRTLHCRVVHEDAELRCASRSLVELTLTNIVENAIRHSRPGTDIAVSCDVATGIVSVCDAGPGIRMRAASDGRVVYSRADGVVKSGSGLGLAIVRRLMETAGGSLRFLPNAAGGTCVELAYPTSANG